MIDIKRFDNKRIFICCNIIMSNQKLCISIAIKKKKKERKKKKELILDIITPKNE